MLVKLLETENYVADDIFTRMCITINSVNNCYVAKMPDAQ